MSNPPDPERVPVEIDVEQLARRLDASAELLLLDCREPQEHAVARLPGATLIPMGELPSQMEQLAPWRDRPVVVYCHHGGRSEMVCQYLRGQGFQQVQNLRGGIDAWSLRIDPSLPRY